MSEDQLWQHLLSHAVVDFHLSISEFWDLTFREYDFIHKRWKEVERYLDYRTGVIASAAITGMGNSKGDGTPFTAEDFFPSLRTSQKSLIEPTQTVQEQIEAMEYFTTIFSIQEKIDKGIIKRGD